VKRSANGGFTRFIHWRKPREVSKVEDALIEELELELSAILAVPLGQWNQVADGYSNIWGAANIGFGIHRPQSAPAKIL
jgi:hypothetical protein